MKFFLTEKYPTESYPPVVRSPFTETTCSKKINLPGGESESESEGQDYKIWFTRGDRSFRDYDRMNTLHGQGVSGNDWIICETSESPSHNSYKAGFDDFGLCDQKQSDHDHCDYFRFW